MLPYGRQSIDERDTEAVLAALRSDWLTTGPVVDDFERALALSVGAGVGAVSVTSGTAALHTAYAAAGVGAGDVVLTTPLTFAATATTALQLGAQVAFADVDAATGNLSLASVADALTSRTRVITAVDYAGVPVDASAFTELAHAHDALFVEDAAHSIGSTFRGVPVGVVADLTTFSFFPTKNLTTAEGGAVISPTPALVDRARAFKAHGIVRDPARYRNVEEGAWYYEVQSLGLNYRLPDVLAALGLSQLARLGEFARRRREIVRRYNEGLADVEEVVLPTDPVGTEPVRHLYPVLVERTRRRAVFDSLRDQGIGVQVNYIPVHHHPLFEDLGYQRGICPVAEDFAAREISLPLFPDLSDADVDHVIDAMRVAVAGRAW